MFKIEYKLSNTLDGQNVERIMVERCLSLFGINIELVNNPEKNDGKLYQLMAQKVMESFGTEKLPGGGFYIKKISDHYFLTKCPIAKDSMYIDQSPYRDMEEVKLNQKNVERLILGVYKRSRQGEVFTNLMEVIYDLNKLITTGESEKFEYERKNTFRNKIKYRDHIAHESVQHICSYYSRIFNRVLYHNKDIIWY